MKLKLIQLRKPPEANSNGNCRVWYPTSFLVNVETGEPIVGVQGVELKVTNRGTEAAVTILDIDVEIRDRLPDEKLPGEEASVQA